MSATVNVTPSSAASCAADRPVSAQRSIAASTRKSSSAWVSTPSSTIGVVGAQRAAGGGGGALAGVSPAVCIPLPVSAGACGGVEGGVAAVSVPDESVPEVSAPEDSGGGASVPRQSHFVEVLVPLPAAPTPPLAASNGRGIDTPF